MLLPLFSSAIDTVAVGAERNRKMDRGIGDSELIRVLALEIVLIAAAAALLVSIAWSAALFWLRPRWLERALRAQGLRGTRYRFPSGDLMENTRLTVEARAKPLPLTHSIIPRVSPFLQRAIDQYGNRIMKGYAAPSM